jgi:hypothetical protein
MRYGLKCPVSSRIRLPGVMTTKWEEFDLELAPDGAGFFARLSLSVGGQDASLYRNENTINHDLKLLKVQVNRDEALHARMLAAIHSLESFLCFYGNLERIHWTTVESVFEAESEEEKSLLKIEAWSITPAINDPVVDFIAEQVDLLIARAQQCHSLTTTLSFYREGLNDVRVYRHISAFFNFYFVIEGLCGNGKTKNPAVEAEFKRSPVLTNAIQEWLKRGIPQPMGDDVGIVDRLKRMNKKVSVENIIHLLVWSRGDLHHYVGNPHKQTGSPLTQQHYMSLSQLALYLAQAVLLSELNRMDPERSSSFPQQA